MLEKTRSIELKKHVGAIHSAHTMTLVQRKIANGLLYNAYEDLMDKDEHEISIKELCHLIGYDSNDYKTIKRSLVNLLSTVVEWNLVDRDNPEAENIWNASSIIADASINGSTCTYSYSKRMKELLYRPEIYGRLNMAVQARFKSNYGLALYENCIRYQNLEYTPWFEFDTFKKLMGVEKDKYVIFRDFKRRVLDKAVQEVNCHAPIRIEPDLRTSNRKPIAIRFSIKCNSTQKIENLKRTVVPQTSKNLLERLQLDFALSKKMAEEIMNKYDADYILSKIALIEGSTSFLKGKIVNLAKYLLSSLEKDYQPPKSSKERVGEKQALEMNKIAKIAEHKKKTEEMATKYERFVYRSILDEYQRLEPAKKQEINKKFEQTLGGLYLNVFKTQGLNHTVLADKFCAFIKTSAPDFCSAIVSFEEYLEQALAC